MYSFQCRLIQNIWTFFNSERLNNQLPCTISYLNDESNNDNDIINLFKSYFSFVYEIKKKQLTSKLIIPKFFYIQ